VCWRLRDRPAVAGISCKIAREMTEHVWHGEGVCRRIQCAAGGAAHRQWQQRRRRQTRYRRRMRCKSGSGRCVRRLVRAQTWVTRGRTAGRARGQGQAIKCSEMRCAAALSAPVALCAACVLLRLLRLLLPCPPLPATETTQPNVEGARCRPSRYACLSGPAQCITQLSRVHSTARGPGVIQRAGLRRLQWTCCERQISVHPCSAPSNQPSHLKTPPALSWRAVAPHSLLSHVCSPSLEPSAPNLPPAGTEHSFFPYTFVIHPSLSHPTSLPSHLAFPSAAPSNPRNRKHVRRRPAPAR
jgi:hypothetical protein